MSMAYRNSGKTDFWFSLFEIYLFSNQSSGKIFIPDTHLSLSQHTIHRSHSVHSIQGKPPSRQCRAHTVQQTMRRSYDDHTPIGRFPLCH